MRNPEQAELVQIYVQASGDPELKPLGEASSWPASLYDVWSILKTQEKIDESAQNKAHSKAVR